MKKHLTTTIIFLSAITLISAQRMRKTNKYAFTASANIGQVIPGCTTSQDRWKAGFHLAWGFDLGAEMRLDEHWSAGTNLGLQFFWMDNQGPYDNYTLDFFSPTLTLGVQYLWQSQNGRESFFRISGGLQIGYDTSFVETFDDYQVEITSNDPFYFFARPEIGFRKKTNWKTKTSRYPISYEVGSYVRYFFNGLGEIDFIESTSATSAKPRGFTLGIFFRVLVPYGSRSVKKQAVENFYPPVIYNPRL